MKKTSLILSSLLLTNTVIAGNMVSMFHKELMNKVNLNYKY